MVRSLADKPLVGSWTGRSAPELAGGREAPHPGRPPGPKNWGCTAGHRQFLAAAQPRAMVGAASRDWLTCRLGRRSGATHTIGQRLAAVAFSLTGRVPATPRTAARGRPQGWAGLTSLDHTQGKCGVAESAQRGY